MKFRNMILKHLIKTLRKREFWFTILLYPAIAAGYFYFKDNPELISWVNKIGIWYFIIFFILSLYIVGYVSFELIEKRLHHKIQGDKLRIKQEQTRR